MQSDTPETPEGEKSPPILENHDPEPTVAHSNRELGRILGVSHVAVMRALKSGRITKQGDGTFDVQACRTAWYRNTPLRGGRRSPMRDGVGVVPDGPATAGDRGLEQVEVPADATATVLETLAAHGSPVDGLPTFRDAQTAEVIMKVRKLQLEGDRLKGKLVERAKAHDVLATFERVGRDAWLAWPTAIAPALASDLGIADLTVVERVLTEHVRAHLQVLAAVPPPDDLLPTAT